VPKSSIHWLPDNFWSEESHVDSAQSQLEDAEQQIEGIYDVIKLMFY